mmetsp:Transcript_21409/g.42823  ORF Transcript_21409/g.42823 Transcript_21409/m.42823 type:complete len:168 (-) Transcript_21409:237-740(-)
MRFFDGCRTERLTQHAFESALKLSSCKILRISASVGGLSLRAEVATGSTVDSVEDFRLNVFFRLGVFFFLGSFFGETSLTGTSKNSSSDMESIINDDEEKDELDDEYDELEEDDELDEEELELDEDEELEVDDEEEERDDDELDEDEELDDDEFEFKLQVLDSESLE